MARKAIYDAPKVKRLQGVITRESARAFEQARKALRVIAKWPGTVSDADTIEFLARFWRDRNK